MVNIEAPIILFWFRRDLRLTDNTALFYALQKNRNVLPLFIFDTEIISKLENKRDARVNFVFQNVLALKKELEKQGSTLLIEYGNPVEVFTNLVDEYRVKKVYANSDYEPYGLKRDKAVASILNEHKIDFQLFKDHVIFEKNEIVKADGKPYTVFTPYMKHWKNVFQRTQIEKVNPSTYFNNLVKTGTVPDFNLSVLGFERYEYRFPSLRPDFDLIRNYHLQRDFPAQRGTSKLGLHLRYGTLSIRELIDVASKLNETFLEELIWREFYMQIMWHFPHVCTRSFKPKFDDIKWLNNEEEFNLWCKGRTGYPLVDAGMRELNRTGHMHNRLRMITASFLTKHLLIDWRWGESYFASLLHDYELSSNNGGWQWAAGSGCDAVPYFRIFSPELQLQKFDPKFQYIKHWIPDYKPGHYLRPIVEHNFARQRALKTYKDALGNTQVEETSQLN